MVMVLGDETLYNRDGIVYPKESGVMGQIKRLIGITGVRQAEDKPGVWEVTKDLFRVFARPYIFLPGMAYDFIL